MVAAGPRQVGAVALAAGLSIAIGLPALVAFNLPPSPTALNQSAAVGAWGLACILVAAQARPAVPGRAALGHVAFVASALGLLASAALLSWLIADLPSELAVSAAGTIAPAALVLIAGASARPTTGLWAGLFAALVVAGAASVAIGVIQVFAADAFGGPWIARAGIAGRAVGNLRQPNHLSTLLMWSAVAVVPLLGWASQRPNAAARVALGVLFALLLSGVVLSGSRTGLLGVALLVAWGAIDRSLTRSARVLLIISPLICLVTSGLLAWWSSVANLGALGVATRLGESDDISGSRFAVWRDTVTLIAQHPWQGVGFGEFNFAWTLTPFPARNVQFFDHTHNLPLHLAVELGIPLALLLLALLAWGLWQAYVRSCRVPGGTDGVARRAALVMVLLMAWHSQLEYPLWYAYFLMPTAFLWGLCLRHTAAPPQPTPAASVPWLATGGGAMVLAAAVTLWDYQRVVAIFAPSLGSSATLAERIDNGRRSWFFAHHADYALVTAVDGANALPGVFDRAPHHLLDTRLMIAWARGLAAQGDVDRARHIAARLREFRNPASKPFFAPCDDDAVTDKPFQCSPPGRAYSWRDFR